MCLFSEQVKLSLDAIVALVSCVLQMLYMAVKGCELLREKALYKCMLLLLLIVLQLQLS